MYHQSQLLDLIPHLLFFIFLLLDLLVHAFPKSICVKWNATLSSRIWTGVGKFISNDNNRYFWLRLT